MTMTSLCREIRKSILRASHASGQGHIPSSFSVVEMLCALYDTMRHDPRNPSWEERDVFVLSKGHAALGLYCTLAHYGYFSVAELTTFGAFRSRLGCHPDRSKVPGIEVSTGSLGHGIGLAVGIALGLQLKQAPQRVFTLIGDGEANEGTVWESLMVASHLQLKNLTILYDNNDSQTRSLPISNPAERFAAFGCEVKDVDGHDLNALKETLSAPLLGPRVVVANTVKGFGCRTLVGNVYEWHRKAPNEEQLSNLLGELNEEAV